MNNKRKYTARYTAEFKQEAIKLVTEQGYTQAEASRNLGISIKNLSRWIGAAKKNGLGAVKSQQKLSKEQEELQQLRKENKRLKMERELLKKAAAFFANELK